jgi:hypothetical protein
MKYSLYHDDTIVVYQGVVTRLKVVKDLLQMTEEDTDVEDLRAANMKEITNYLNVQHATDNTERGST